MNLPCTHAVINVSGLRLRTYIGFKPDERVKQQDVVIHMQIRYRVSTSVFEDQVEGALNYKAITKNVIKHVENGRFLLLERMVADVLAICSADARVAYARVTIDKPHALRFSDSVSLTMESNVDTPNALEKVA